MADFDHKNDKAIQEKLGILLFQLSELVKDPPTPIDFYDWRDNVSHVMKEIKAISLKSYDRLDDLVLAIERYGEQHVNDIENEVSPAEIAHSAERYFQQAAFLTSEINSLKRP